MHKVCAYSALDFHARTHTHFANMALQTGASGGAASEQQLIKTTAQHRPQSSHGGSLYYVVEVPRSSCRAGGVADAGGHGYTETEGISVEY